MAGDWIKMRTNLWDDPRVSRVCDLTSKQEATIVGGLYWLWSTADQHSADGDMAGYTLAQIDRKTGIKGFGAALVAVGWLDETPSGVCLPRFNEHNGASAKRRALETKRKTDARSASGDDRNMSERIDDWMRTKRGQMSASDADRLRTREEKRREEENTTPNPPASRRGLRSNRSNPRSAGTNPRSAADEPEGFRAFWDAWPSHHRKADKPKCVKRWLGDACEERTAEIVEKVEAWKRSEDWTKDNGQFIPAPLVWLNQRKYDAPAPQSDVPEGVVFKRGQATIGGFVC